MLLFALGLERLVTLVPDDSFFYLVVARNFPSHFEFTFDGLHQTYGFQPLWQVLLLPLGFLELGPGALFGAVVAACAALHVASGFLLARLVGKLVPDVRVAWVQAATVLAWWLNPGVMRWFWGAKENGLYFVLLAWLAVEVVSVFEGERRERLVGLLAGLACLARVTFIPLFAFASGLLIVGSLARRSPGGVRRVLLVDAVALAVAAPWFLFARVHFGTAMPISGLVKFEQAAVFAEGNGMQWGDASYWAHVLRQLPGYADQTFKLGFGPWGPVLLALALVALGASLRARWPLVRSRAAAAVVLLLGVLALVNSTMTAFALPTFLAYGQWYTVPEYLFGFVVFCLLTSRVLRAGSRATWALAWTVPLTFLAWGSLRARGVSFAFDPSALDYEVHPNRVLMAAGELVAARAEGAPTGPTPIVAAWDPGILAYFSERPIVSLDPLMNSLAYNAEGKHDVGAYLRELDIAYVFGPAHVEGERLVLNNAPDGSYEVLPSPLDDVRLGWNPELDERYVLTRWRAQKSSDPFILP